MRRSFPFLAVAAVLLLATPSWADVTFTFQENGSNTSTHLAFEQLR